MFEGAKPKEGVRPATILRELRLCAHPQGRVHDLAPLREGVRSAAILEELWQRAHPPKVCVLPQVAGNSGSAHKKKKYRCLCGSSGHVCPVRPFRPSTSVPSVHVRPRPSRPSRPSTSILLIPQALPRTKFTTSSSACPQMCRCACSQPRWRQRFWT